MASSSNAGVQQLQTSIFKFDGKNNFAMWKHLMLLYLNSNGYGDIIEKDFVEPTQTE